MSFFNNWLYAFWFKKHWLSRGLDVLGKIIKLVINFFFLSPFTYCLLLLVVQAEKEWITEKKQGYFQTQLLFPSLQPFRKAECFSWISKVAVLSVKVSIGIWEVSFWRQEAHIFRHA